MLNRDQKKTFAYFFDKYGLRVYNNTKKPAIFYSAWSFGQIAHHTAFGIIIWRGSDIIKLKSRLKIIKRMKNIHHVSISSFISQDLDAVGIKYKFIPIVGVNMNYYTPCPLGDEIYTYVPTNNKSKYYYRYGMDVIEKIQQRCNYKINILGPPFKYNRKQLLKIYKRCFCCLRLTVHDGLPNTVIEMSLMGRKSIYNGNIPGSIKWDRNDIDKIVEKIKIEAQKIGTIDNEYPKKIKKFLNVGYQWLDTEYWKIK